MLLAVIDGMGGHAEGARAAETALATLLEAFWQTPHPIFDPLGFLHLSLGRAHEEVVKLGVDLSVESRPRATCAVCLVQDAAAYWAHVGDSRVYQLRQRTGAGAHPRPQPRRGAAARGPDHASRGARPPDAQLRRVLPRRRRDAARDEHLDAPPAEGGRRAAAVHRRPVGQPDATRTSCASRWRTAQPLQDALLELGTQAVARGRAATATTPRPRRCAGERHERCVPAAAPPTSCGRWPSARALHARTRRARCWSEFGDTRVLCTASVEERRAAVPARQAARAGSRPSTACCRAPRTRARRARPRAASRPDARRRSSA